MENKTVSWIVGCGDIGRRLAELLLKQNFAQNENKNVVYGIVSSEDSYAKCSQLSIKAQITNLDSVYTLDPHDLHNNDVYYFAPPPANGAKDTRLKRFLNNLNTAEQSKLPRRIVLISTTGVYGDSAGEWIDENTPVKPQADRAVRRLSAEQILQRWAAKFECEFMILRVPGIYAENRLPLARLEKGLPIVNAKEAGFTNRIHADDLARACKAAMECNQANQIINVTDGNPSTMTDYFNRVADYAKLPRPPQISMQEAERTLSEGMVSYLKESRRIKNDKMLAVLGIELLHPSLVETLKPPL